MSEPKGARVRAPFGLYKVQFKPGAPAGLVLGCGCVAILLHLAVWAVALYVLVHFIRKFW